MSYTMLYVNDIIIKILNTKEKRWNLKGGGESEDLDSKCDLITFKCGQSNPLTASIAVSLYAIEWYQHLLTEAL